jgi:hypothetical protein
VSGERDLARLLAELDPHLHPERYGFQDTSDATLDDADFAIVREEEGLTVIRPHAAGQWARISLGVHSSLEAVGLTATLSARLAEAGISANIVTGLRHDHLFVPWDRREQALDCLRAR